jgi:tetratricopeptide (TPR) repeat protein
MKFVSFLLILLSFSSWSVQLAKPEPTELLMFSVQTPLSPEMQRFAEQLKNTPGNDTLRLKLIRLYLQGARSPGFDDWFHQAEMLLAEVTAAGRVDTQYWLQLADMQQQQHQFDSALSSLEHVLANLPTDTNASLMAARIYLAQDKSAQAQQACARLWQQLFLFSVCSYEVAGRKGNAEQSYPALQLLFHRQDDVPAALDIWARGILAEQAEMIGKPQDALAWLVPILPQAPVSLWLKWADLALQLNQSALVYQQLAELHEQYGLNDALLLRLVLAERIQQAARSAFAAELASRMNLRIARGDKDHAADMVHYFLKVKPDAAAALHWAKINFETAKEPDDKRLLQLSQQAVLQTTGKSQ